MALAIVPARGGSKSIPRKNIADLGGRPLISYALTALRASRHVDRCVVTTDDEEIAAVARQWGGETPFMRPPELALDTTPTIPVIEHALRWLAREQGYRSEYVFLIQPTEPFVETSHIDALYELAIRKQADSAITMIRVPRIYHPYHVRRMTDDGYLEFADEAAHYAHPTRQSDPPRYAFANLYLFRADRFLAERKLEVGKRVGLEVDPRAAFDINTPDDLTLARALLCPPSKN